MRTLGRSAITFIAATALTGCSSDTPPYRYRMTVEVSTPEGPRKGSSVIEVHTSYSGGDLPGRSWSARARGEAAVVDFGKRGVLFALMQSEDDGDWASDVMLNVAPPGADENGDRFIGRYRNLLNMRSAVSLPHYYRVNRERPESTGLPMLVTFKDLKDPRSVRKVDPGDLAASFGPGVKLSTITVQLTSDGETNEVLKYLPWLPKYADRHFDGSSNSFQDLVTKDQAARLSASNFRMEFRQ